MIFGPDTTKWRRWQSDPIISGNDYLYVGTEKRLNPSRDLLLKVTFTRCDSNKNITHETQGFWYGNDAPDLDGKTFRVRGAFPPGTWQWVLTCSVRDGARPDTPDCSEDLSRKGRFEVTDSGGGALYDRGFLRLPTKKEKPLSLRYDNGEQFFWLGDTVWNANVLMTNDEFRMLADDRRDAFTIFQMGFAPKPALENKPGAVQPFVPTGGPGCPDGTAEGPGPCWRFNPQFWRDFDQKIEDANARGIVVALAGFIHPITDQPGAVPTDEVEAQIFAENIVGRTAGNFVIHSPGFDHRLENEKNQTIVRLVGNDLRRSDLFNNPPNPITSRHLITNHVAGRSPFTVYTNFLHDQIWLNFHLFQSGTPQNNGGEPECDGLGTEDSELCNLTRRAVLLAEKISMKKPLKVAINGESVYPGMDPLVNHTPYRARQTAYYSMLNGAQGYTMGTCGVFDWRLPTAVGFAGCKWNGNWLHEGAVFTANNTRILRSHFQSIPSWLTLKPQSMKRIKNQPNEPAPGKQAKQMALAYDNKAALLAYVPSGVPTIKIDFGGLPKFPGNWVAHWLNPREVADPIPVALPHGGILELTKPVAPQPGAGSDQPDCEQTYEPFVPCNDWVLRVTKKGKTKPSTSNTFIQVMEGASSASQSTLIKRQTTDPEGAVLTQIDLSSGNHGQPGVPQIATEANGHSMVVWQAYTRTSTTILGRILDDQGSPVTDEFVIASGKTASPGHPTVEAIGNEFLVAWAGTDRYRSGSWIRMRRYSRTGEIRPNPEFAVGCEYLPGDFPDVTASGTNGGYTVTWELSETNGIQMLQIEGASKYEMRLAESATSVPVVESLDGSPGSSVTVTYGLYDEDGTALGVQTVTVTPPAAHCDPPALAVDDSFATQAGKKITIGIDDLLENDAPGLTFVSVGSKCQLTAGRRACTYVSPSGFPAPGTDTFSYTVRNSEGVLASATVTIAVSGSALPTANPDSFTVERGQSLTITSTQLLQNDSPGAVFAGVKNAVNGSISCTGTNPATCTFTPSLSSAGTASFQYDISSTGSAPFATGNVTINVTEPGTGLQASFTVSCVNRTCSVDDTSTGSITRWQWNWGDGTPLLEPGSGSDQSHTYAHSGSYTIVLSVFNAAGQSSTAQRTVVANTPPVAIADSATTRRDTAVTINVLTNDSDPDGDAIALTDDSVIFPPAHGSALKVDGSKIQYTPNSGFVGTDQFRYEITDALGAPASAIVTVQVTNIPGPPVARNDQAKTKRDTPVTINLLENDQDPDGQAIWLTVNPIKTPPRHGTVEVLSLTSVRYTPDPQWGGNDVFEYQIADASGAKDRAWVAVHVGRTRSLPVAHDDSAATTANRAVTIDVLANDSSPDGDPIALTRNPFLSKPLHGRVTRLSGSQVSYTPQADWTGTDTFAYEISDSEYGTAAAFVTVTVTSENRPPVANPDSAATAAGVSLTINVIGNDTDLDGDLLELVSDPIVAGPQHGSATRASASSITYTPAAGYAGTDSFTYAISDGRVTVQGTVTITISVANTNHPPEAADDEAATTAGVAVTIEVTANDSDADGDQVSLISSPVTTPPANGTAVKVNGSSITYTPRSGYSGTDRFEYEIGDHNGARARAWVDVTIGAGTVNHNPVAVDDEVTMLESSSKDFVVTGNDTDPDGDPVSLISSPITFPPAHGTATRLSNSTIRYTPDAGYVGMDTLQYEIGDGRGKRSRAWMRVMVRDANSRPVAVGDEASTTAGTAVTVNVTANDYDPDGDVVRLLAGSSPIITPPDHGTATKVDANSIRYLPQAGFGGTDRFQYEISDGRGGHHRAWVNITVSGGGSSANLRSVAASSTGGVPPLAGNDTAEAFTDTAVAVVVLSNDLTVDGRPVVLTASPIVTPPLYGTAQRASDTTITYTPSIAFRGNDRLEYEVVDADGVTTTAWVTVQIPGDNKAPVAVDDDTAAAKDGSVAITPAVNDTDENGDALVLTVRAVVAAPQNGTVRRESDQQLVYTPAPGFTGDDSFVYEITDRRGGTAQATVVVHVIGGARPPVALNDSAGVQSGKAVAVNVVANDSDPDGDPVRVVASLPPQHGTILWSGGTATYQSHSGYVGSDSFTYTINDSTGLSAQGTVSIAVAVLNRSTIAADDSVQTKTRTPVLVGVLANDYDPDPQKLTIASVTQPARGTVAISNDRLSVTYTPAGDFAGNDAFQYTVTDGHGSVTASAAVTVVNQAPWPHSEILSAPEDTWVGYQSYNVLANDVDPDGDELHIVSVEQPAYGQFQISPDGSQFSYKSKPDWSGMDSFYYTVGDPFGARVRVLAQISVSAVNDSPVANDDSFSVYKNQPLNLTQAEVVANDTDVEGHQISVHLVGPATNGTTEILPDGSIQYTPYGEFVGTDSFEYTAEDSGGGAYATARITVNVLQDTRPVAAFTVTCNGFVCAFDASSSTDDRGIVSYQWLLKTGAPSSTPAAAKTFSFTYPNEGVFEARLTVEDVLGQTAVAVEWVTICAPPAIASQPVSQTIFSGYTATLSVTAGGTGPFSYQWYEGTAGTTSTPVGTNSTYTTPGLTANKSYWVRVTSTCSGSAVRVDSNTATVTVCQVPGIATQPASKTINAGSAATLSVVASGSGPFTYQWYDADTNAFAGSGSTYTTPALTATKSYFVRVTSTCNGSVSVSSQIATVTVCDPPLITTHPAPKLINAGATATLTVAASGSGTFSYQWYEGASGTTTTPVGTNSDTFTTPPLSSTKTYWARVTSACNGNTANSHPATVTVCSPPGIATQPASKTIPTGSSTTLTVVPNGSGPFSYQWYAGAAPSTATPVGTNSSSFTTPVLTANTSYWVRVTSWCNGSASVNSSTATITMGCATAPSISASPTSRTIVAGQSTTLSVTASGFGALTYQWYQGTAPSTATPVGTNSSSLTVTPAATTNYWVRVSNACGGTASATATVTICNPPAITTHPASTTIQYNATATLSVVASGTGPFSYQWYEGASGVTTTPVGTNSTSFTTPPLAATKSYWVRVSNACSTNSNSATVTVNGAVLARRQFAGKTANSQLTISGNWTQPTQAGTLLVAIVSAERGAYPIANWQPPAGWQHAVSYEMTNVKTSIYYYPNNPGGRTAETFGNGGYYDDMILQLAEYTGVATVSPLDRTAFNGGHSNDGYVDTGYTAQTSQAKELVITALTSYAMTEFYSPSNGFLELDDRNQGWGNLTTAVHEKIVTTAGPWGHSTQVTDPAQWVGVVATFKGQ